MAKRFADLGVALVTGAGRGIGRGIAVGLAEVGATVYLTGRHPETIASTADLVTAAGGTPIALVCDHASDTQVATVFDIIRRDHGRLDLLVNNATAFPGQRYLFSATPFWEIEPTTWDGMFDVGLRSAFIASRLAVPMMLGQGHGLIVNISSAGAQSKFAIAPYGVAKAALDRLTADMAVDLGGTGVVALSLWPPPTATENQLAAVGEDDNPTTWSLPVFTGRVIARLAASTDLPERAGRAHRVRDLARELGVVDVLWTGGA